MAKLAMDLHDEIKRLIRDPKYGSSDRARDQARTKLKRLGLIEFDRLPGDSGGLGNCQQLFAQGQQAGMQRLPFRRDAGISHGSPRASTPAPA